ncbi:MAG TPA: inositol-3-phosphate synthase, partial [Solirubrobacter sp.]|nr:inositol-3-phosphate synthase [Solirubrobacter sp.]
FGGHDVVETPLAIRAGKLVDDGVLPAGLPSALAGALEAAEAEQRPGITGREARTEPQAALARIVTDLNAFRTRHELSRVVVVNVSSTEAPVDPHPAHADPRALMDALDANLGVLPPSALYALAAIETGSAYVDFTPSVGARLPAIEALAEANEVPLAGSDGKTGETFMKSVLAPAFASRALKVRSWAGMNLLGGGDGAALADPDRARSKLDSKGRLLEEILGYPVEGPIHIEDVRDMGEWKTAWDHIVFEGFLGVRMKLQFTWEGCDSTLAAPLLLDLVRLTALALDRGESGPLTNLAFFFKDPAGTNEHRLHAQYEMLERWVLQKVTA